MLEPLGIEADQPRLSWKLRTAAGEANKSRSARRIPVTSTAANLASDTGGIWDSGKATSPQSRAIHHAGPALSYWQALY